METSFLSFFVVKLKQIHIDRGITAGYSTNILQCEGVTEQQANLACDDAQVNQPNKHS